jgi:hypothetical protein
MQSNSSSGPLHAVSYARLEIKTQNSLVHVGADCTHVITNHSVDPGKRVCTNILPLWRYVDGLGVVLYVCTTCGAYA